MKFNDGGQQTPACGRSAAPQGCAQPGMRRLKEKLERHIRQLAPHVRERETGQLLIAALAEITRLENEVVVQAYWGGRWEQEHTVNMQLRKEIAQLQRALTEQSEARL